MKTLFKTLFAAKPAADMPDDTSFNPRKLTLAGLSIILVFFGAFGGWAALAPLDSAVLAPGFVKVSGERKLVQHLEGGIVDSIAVREGDIVKAGQVLLVLDDKQARARLELLQGRWFNRIALSARLAAERDGAAAVSFPDELVRADSPAARDAMKTQSDIFDARLKALHGNTVILEKRILQTGNEIEGLQALNEAKDRLIQTLNEEATDLEGLFAKGLTTRERHLALRRRQAEIEGERAANIAAIARARNSIAEMEQRILELKTARMNDAVAELAAAEAELYDIGQQKASAEDILNRLPVRAPVDGVVVGLKVHTRGGVVGAGNELMQIVPLGEALVVEARVRPEDINAIAEGQPVQVRVTAFAHLGLPPISGMVKVVSADRLVDERSGYPYFAALVQMNEDDIRALEGVSLLPGMGADVTIRTGARTMAEYLAEPLARTMRHAIRE